MSEQTQTAKVGAGRAVGIAVGLIVVVFGGFFVAAILGPKLKDQATLEGAQAAAAAQLRDPSSAQFRNVRVNGSHVCGEINGKNGFGAYNGFVRFHGDKGSADVDPGDVGPKFNGEPVMKTAFETSYKIWCES
jgi:hypothetical protein